MPDSVEGLADVTKYWPYFFAVIDSLAESMIRLNQLICCRITLEMLGIA